MNLELSTQYYLKAVDYYPYNLEFTIENIQYALGYDPDHPQALCLLGKIYMYQLKDYENAKRCFKQSIIADGNYPENYRLLSIIHIWKGEYSAANKLIEYALIKPGQNRESLLRIKSMLYEYKGDLREARLLLKRARELSICAHQIAQIKTDLSRLKEKHRKQKKAIKKSTRVRV